MAVRQTGNPYNAGIDANNWPTLTAVSGTAGTADTAGTAEIIAIGGNPTTGALYVQDLSGATGTTNVSVVNGTLTRISTIGTLELGSMVNTGTNVNVVTGTLQNVGTVSAIATGTLNALATGTITTGTVSVTIGTIIGPVASGGSETGAPVPIGGTDSGGTVRLPLVTTGGVLAANIPSGTINVGTVTASLTSSGTLLNLATGTLALVTTLSNLTNGSVNILTGTIQSSGTTTGVGVVSNLTNGSINLLTGTLTSLTNLAAGTVQINPVPVPATLTFGTLGTAGGSFFGTISAASGAGTRHFISGVDVVIQSGSPDIRVLAGTLIQGTGVLAEAYGTLAGAGISKRINPAFATGTNSEIIYHFVAAGTAFIVVNYWRGV